MKNKNLNDIVGKELTATKYFELEAFIRNTRVVFSNTLRIEIQDKAKKVGTEISGSEFGQWLNSYVANQLTNQKEI